MKCTADALSEEGYECAAYVVDISDKEKVYEAAKKVKQEIGKVDILINNAGIVTCRPFLELPDKAIEATYGVNILSHYWVKLHIVLNLSRLLKVSKFHRPQKLFSPT